MTIYCGMIAYNEEYLIGASIKSVLDFVDKVIVIDGSPWGPSTDNTAEIARSLGKKVTVISCFSEDEMLQRNDYLSFMERSEHNWCIKLDADEVWLPEMLCKLEDRILRAERQTMLFRYRSYEFFKTGDIVELGQQYLQSNALGAWRLTKGVRHRTYHQIGDTHNDWTSCGSPTTLILPEVWFHHYGHAQPEDRVREKHLVALRLGLKRRYGFEPWEEERYLKERWGIYWNPSKAILLREFGMYTGRHPSEVRGLIAGVE